MGGKGSDFKPLAGKFGGCKRSYTPLRLSRETSVGGLGCFACSPQTPASLISAVLQDESSGWKSGGGLPGYSLQWCYTGSQPWSCQ